jgi:hypothetical protein
VLATGFGAITGAVLGSEVAEHWYQLYKMDKQGANLRFIYWWEDKVSGLFLVLSCPPLLHMMIQFLSVTCLYFCLSPNVRSWYVYCLS